MKRFSERLGIVDSTPFLQMDGMSNVLRNSLWNRMHSLFDADSEHWVKLAQWTAVYFRKVPVDELSYHWPVCRDWVKTYFFSLPWSEVYDLIEVVVNNYTTIVGDPRSRYLNLTLPHRQKLELGFNFILKSEHSGYRFIAGVLAPITNPAETTEVSGALELTERVDLGGAHKHIQTALSLFGKRPDPDYRNSIKESISAVESIARVLGKKDSKGLADALAELDKRTPIHGALKSGFIHLYGYTSNEDGVRHAILDEPQIGFDEAKFMLVSCSAFVNYLISKAQLGGLMESVAK
jgi:hypothetical protein